MGVCWTHWYPKLAITVAFDFSHSAPPSSRMFVVGGCSPAESYANEIGADSPMRSHGVYLRLSADSVIVTAGLCLLRLDRNSR